MSRFFRPAWFLTPPLLLAPDAPAEGEGDGEGGGDDAARELFKSKEGQSALGIFAAKLWEDNKRIRDKNKDQRAEIATLKTKVPAEGSVVLAGDDATAHKAIVALGVPLKDVAAHLTTGKADAAELAKVKARDVAREAASLAEDGVVWDEEVLSDRLERDGLHLEIATVTETVDGQQVTTKVPKVRKAADAAAALTDLDAYALANWTKYLPALRGADAAPADRPAPRTRAPATPPTPRTPAPVTRSGEQPRTDATPSKEQLERSALATGQYARF